MGGDDTGAGQEVAWVRRQRDGGGGGGRRRGIEVLLMSKNDEVLDRVLRCSKHSAEM